MRILKIKNNVELKYERKSDGRRRKAWRSQALLRSESPTPRILLDSVATVVPPSAKARACACHPLTLINTRDKVLLFYLFFFFKLKL